MPKSKSHGNSPDDGTDALTAGDWELLRACVALPDYCGKTVAKHLCISINTYYSRSQRINAALGTHSIAASIALLVRQGKLAPNDDNTARGGEGDRK